MRVAFLFPGHGEARDRFGVEFYEHFTLVRQLIDLAAQRIGKTYAELIYCKGEALKKTALFQPTLTALSLGIHAEFVRLGICPQWVSGLSTGEIAAWSASGAVTAVDAVELAAERGQIVGDRTAKTPGGMLAIFNCDRAAADEAVTLGRRFGDIWFSGHLAPNESVLSGDLTALREVSNSFSSFFLDVAGPWHSPMMADSYAEIENLFQQVDTSPPAARFISNRTGRVVENPEKVRSHLVEQLVHPILWKETIDTLLKQGVTDIVSIGPGKVLTGLIKKNLLVNSDIRIHTTRTREEFERCAEALLQLSQ
jgi:[acyl-carrier-protein] S-malonyltransferase